MLSHAPLQRVRLGTLLLDLPQAHSDVLDLRLHDSEAVAEEDTTDDESEAMDIECADEFRRVWTVFSIFASRCPF